MSQKLSFVFPGQGSQSVGMLSGLSESFPIVKQTFEEASDALGVDLWRMCQDGPDTDLNRTENTQPAMLVAGIATWRVWMVEGGSSAAVSAGHSLGEYSALVAAGAMAFGDALRVVSQRGRFMQEAVPEGDGAMAAILGLSDLDVAAVCHDAEQGSVVEPVNYNSPGQVVIAGEADAVQRAVEEAKKKGAKRAILLPVSVPSHCSLMEAAALDLGAVLDDVEIRLPGLPVLHNVSVESAATVEDLREMLTHQLHRPVRWVETIRKMAADGTELVLELGPGKVLTGLNKRIDKGLKSLAVFDPASLEAALEAANA